jgi:hypothetical protein
MLYKWKNREKCGNTYELSCLHSVELGLLFIYSCFGCVVNLDSYQLISQTEIYNILKCAGNKINKI